MTKKFWIDWQKRIEDTKSIHLFYEVVDGKNIVRKQFTINNNVFDKNNGDILLNANFNNDTVDLTIERHTYTFSKELRKLVPITIKDNITLNREDIGTVYFMKKLTEDIKNIIKELVFDWNFRLRFYPHHVTEDKLTENDKSLVEIYKLMLSLNPKPPIEK